MFSTIRTTLACVASHPDDPIVTLHLRTTARIAKGISSDVEKLLSDDEIGIHLRASLARLTRHNAPAIELFTGYTSTCRINGPLIAPPSYTEGRYLPSDGLIESPGYSAHLTSYEASEVMDLLRNTVDEVLTGWLEAREEDSSSADITEEP